MEVRQHVAAIERVYGILRELDGIDITLLWADLDLRDPEALASFSDDELIWLGDVHGDSSHEVIGSDLVFTVTVTVTGVEVGLRDFVDGYVSEYLERIDEELIYETKEGPREAGPPCCLCRREASRRTCSTSCSRSGRASRGNTSSA